MEKDFKFLLFIFISVSLNVPCQYWPVLMSVNNIFCEPYCIVAFFFFLSIWPDSNWNLFFLFSTRDMSTSPMTLCPWWICGDWFSFSPEHSQTVLSNCRHYTGENTHFIFRTVLSKRRPRVYHLYGLQLFSKGTTLWTFFFCSLRKIPHIIALSKQTATIRLMDWQTSGSSTPLFLSVCALVPYVCFCHQ